MKILIIYFSQTGNTQKVADTLNKEFISQGFDSKTMSMFDVKTKDILNADVIGFGSPTFECHAPTPVKDFIKSLPDFFQKKSFVFATGGGAGGNILSDLKKLLSSKRFIILDSHFTLGEIFHPAPCIFGNSKDRPNIKDLNQVREFAINLSKYIAEGKVAKNRSLKNKLGFYNLVGLIGSSDKVIRFLVPKPKLNFNKCKKCSLCKNECPVNNIVLNHHPKLNRNCIRCYRCQTVCPSKAYEVNWRYGNIVVSTLWNKTFMKTFGQLKD